MNNIILLIGMAYKSSFTMEFWRILNFLYATILVFCGLYARVFGTSEVGWVLQSIALSSLRLFGDRLVTESANFKTKRSEVTKESIKITDPESDTELDKPPNYSLDVKLC